jgi:hypothetical protein
MNRPSNRDPWYLSERFFNFFFSSVLGFMFLALVLQAGFAIFVVTQAQGDGLLPAAERILCGDPGCLKTYIGSQE